MGWFRHAPELVLAICLCTCRGEIKKDPVQTKTAVISLENLALEGERFAVLASVNAYAEPSKTATLSGPKNDLDALAQVLLDRYGFAPDHILRLHGPAATREGILRSLAALAARAQPGRQLVFAFAGHGSFLPDEDLTEEANGQDETLCPYDRDLPRVGDITDDRLNEAFSAILERGAYLTVLLDACYSGNASKQTGPITIRSAPPLRLSPARVVVSSQRDLQRDRFTVLASAEENQTAGETSFAHGILPVGIYGIFFHALNRALREAPPDTTWGDLSVFLTQEVRLKNRTQRPVFRHGLQNRIFGKKLETREGHLFRVHGLSRQGLQIELEKGSMSGLTAGSLLAVYAPGARQLAAGKKPLAWYRVSEAEPHRASASLISENAPSPEKVAVGYPVAHVLSGDQHREWPVFLSDKIPEPWAAALRQSLEEYPELSSEVSSGARNIRESFKCELVESHAGLPALHIEGPAFIQPMELADHPPQDLAKKISRLLLRIVYWEKLRQIHNPDAFARATPPVEIKLERGRDLEPEFEIYEPLGPSETGVLRFQDEDLIRLSYTNLSEKPLFVTAFFLNNSGGVIAWNDDQYDGLLLPTQKVVVTDWIEISKPFGREWVKLFINGRKPFDPNPFLQGSKDPNQSVEEQIYDYSLDWWTLTLEIESVPKPAPE